MADEANDPVAQTQAPAEDPGVAGKGGSDSENETASFTQWTQRIERCKAHKRELTPDWDQNVDYRRGKQFDIVSDQYRISVNQDWPLTKAKEAALFSPVPSVSATSDVAQFKPIATLFGRALNKRITKVKAD